MRKLIYVLIGMVVVVALVKGITSYMNHFDYDGEVIFAEGDKLYIARLDKPGKRLLATVKGVEALEVLDCSSGAESILLKAEYNLREELLIFSQGNVKKIYEVRQKEIALDVGSEEFPALPCAVFGKDASEVYFFQDEGLAQNQSLYMSYLYKLDIQSDTLTKLKHLPINYVHIEYSKKLNALLVHMDEAKENGEADLEWSVHLYDIASGKATKLIDNGTQPLWLEDGKKILFHSIEHSSGFYEYNLETGQIKKVFAFNRNWRPSLSADKKYLLVYGKRIGLWLGRVDSLDIISLTEGKVKGINWEKQFGTDICPEEIMLVK